jgi:hypothetical protein
VSEPTGGLDKNESGGRAPWSGAKAAWHGATDRSAMFTPAGW